jgi:hypothetical protein
MFQCSKQIREMQKIFTRIFFCGILPVGWNKAAKIIQTDITLIQPHHEICDEDL